MKVLKDENLKKYTTVKIGGIAERLYFPESIDDLIKLINGFSSKEEYYLISGGSNILINDKKTYKSVICLKNMNTNIEHKGQNIYYVGASISLQKLINTVNKDGYGGIEYLYSVPALVGGSIVMNAGRGKVHNRSISDYIIDVHVYDSGEIKIIKKNMCKFSYRDSVFKDSKTIVLGATFAFDMLHESEAIKRKQERLSLVKKGQDNSGFNFGTVFSEKNRIIMQIIKITHPGFKNGMMYSKKTSNWLINKGDGTFYQAMKLINIVKKFHKLVGSKISTEVIIWK